MGYKAVIFDLDGTLVTTGYGHREGVIKNTLRDLGRKVPSKEVIDIFWFRGKRGEIIRNVFGLNERIFWNVYSNYDTPEFRSKYTEPFYDIKALAEIKNKGYRVGLVTSAPPEIAELEIGMIEDEVCKGIFDYKVAAHTINGFLPKPSPDGINHCLESLVINKNQAIFVGNSDEDIEAAKNAGVTSVFLDRREYDYGNLNPDWNVHSLYDLRDVLSSFK